MKKTIALMLIFVMMLTSTIHTYALESGVKSFSIEEIRPDQKDKFLGINVKLDDTYSNSTMLVAFYTNGKLTKLTPYDVSSKKEFTFDPTLTRDKKKTPNIYQQETLINTYVTVKTSSGNYFVDQTPDEIKIFTWDKSTLKPKTICSNVLTDEVKLKANAKVISSLQTVLEATFYIRENELDYEEDYLDGIVDEWDEHIFPILDYVDYCAANAIIEAGGEVEENYNIPPTDSTTEIKLLTSLYAQERFSEEISKIGALLRQTTERELNKLLSFTDAGVLEEEYYTALNNGLKFLDITLTDYRK